LFVALSVLAVVLAACSGSQSGGEVPITGDLAERTPISEPEPVEVAPTAEPVEVAPTAEPVGRGGLDERAAEFAEGGVREEYAEAGYGVTSGLSAVETGTERLRDAVERQETLVESMLSDAWIAGYCAAAVELAATLPEGC